MELPSGIMELPETAHMIEKLNAEFDDLHKDYTELHEELLRAKKICLGKFFIFTKEEQRALQTHLKITAEDYQELIEKHLGDKYLKYRFH
jgi:hypothetical protein